jgi:diaminopimelate epimerase
MKIEFEKYQGTGNDFILLDNRSGFMKNLPVRALCDRKFGIGADGLMLLELSTGYDFRMVYYNADGNISTMCGNGGRCIAAFAHKLKIGNPKRLFFIAADGEHEALLLPNDIVSLKMNDVAATKVLSANEWELNTGSPHFVRFVEHVNIPDFVALAAGIRNNETYKQEGINVNFVAQNNDGSLSVRTFERGVEDETLSCGTGVTACALAFTEFKNMSAGNHTVEVNTPGGKLEIAFEKTKNGFENIWLTGPATFVYKGQIII